MPLEVPLDKPSPESIASLEDLRNAQVYDFRVDLMHDPQIFIDMPDKKSMEIRCPVIDTKSAEYTWLLEQGKKFGIFFTTPQTWQGGTIKCTFANFARLLKQAQTTGTDEAKAFLAATVDLMDFNMLVAVKGAYAARPNMSEVSDIITFTENIDALHKTLLADKRNDAEVNRATQQVQASLKQIDPLQYKLPEAAVPADTTSVFRLPNWRSSSSRSSQRKKAPFDDTDVENTLRILKVYENALTKLAAVGPYEVAKFIVNFAKTNKPDLSSNSGSDRDLSEKSEYESLHEDFIQARDALDDAVTESESKNPLLVALLMRFMSIENATSSVINPNNRSQHRAQSVLMAVRAHQIYLSPAQTQEYQEKFNYKKGLNAILFSLEIISPEEREKATIMFKAAFPEGRMEDGQLEKLKARVPEHIVHGSVGSYKKRDSDIGKNNINLVQEYIEHVKNSARLSSAR